MGDIVRYIGFALQRGLKEDELLKWELADNNAVKYVFFANTVLIQIQYFLDQISVLLLSLSKFSIAWNRRGFRQIYQARVLKLVTMIGFV